MMVTRRIFEARQLDVFERKEGLELFTSTREPGMGPTGAKNARSWERYYVKGERLGPRQSIVRVFRLRYNEMETAVEDAPRMLAGRSAKPDHGEKSTFTQDPFSSAGLEGFRPVRGYRDLEVEQQLLARLEMVPSLELVGGNAAVPARSLVIEEWGKPAGEHVAPSECGEPLAGAEPLLMPSLTVLLADPLGTRELPTMAARLLCAASRKGLSVALGLSLPASEQPLLDEYLASEGQTQDVERFLVRSSFWRRVYQDGRSSRAVFWLIEQARRMRASGHSVALVAFDSDTATGNAREAEMSGHLLKYRKAHPDTWLLAVAGDVHVRTGGVSWDDDYEPLGARLARELPSLRALSVGFTRGTQFACRYNVWEKVDCNVFALSPIGEASHPRGAPVEVRLFAARSPEGFHGRLYVGELHASPPAIHRLSRSRN